MKLKKLKTSLNEADPTRRALLQALVAFPAAGLVGCSSSADALAGRRSRPRRTTVTPHDADHDRPAHRRRCPPPRRARTTMTIRRRRRPRVRISSRARRCARRSSRRAWPAHAWCSRGRCCSTTCTPVAQALLDFWQADDAGAYDNSGFRLRGHQFTDANGRFTLETVVPGLYPGRTRHIHVKVQRANGSILTTQLYFPGEARNASDGIYSAALLMTVTDGANGREATFNFVV